MDSVHKLIERDAALDKMLRANVDTLEWLTEVAIPRVESAAVHELERTEEKLSELDSPSVPVVESQDMEAVEFEGDGSIVTLDEITTPTITGLDGVSIPDSEQSQSVTTEPMSEIEDVDDSAFTADDVSPQEVSLTEIEDATIEPYSVSELTFPEVPSDVDFDLEEVRNGSDASDSPIFPMPVPEQEQARQPLDAPDLSEDFRLTPPEEVEDVSSPRVDVESLSNVIDPFLSLFEVDDIEQPELKVAEEESEDGSPDVGEVSLDALPDVSLELPPMSASETPDVFTPGFQGFELHPDTGMDALSAADMSDPAEQHNNSVERQFQSVEKSNRDLASQLAFELDPQFTNMRDENAQVVHDYVQGQSLLTSLLRPKDF